MAGPRAFTIAQPGDETRRRPPAPVRPGSVARLLAILALLSLPAGAAFGADAPRPRAAKAAAGSPASITVSYADLIDADVFTRNGRRLGDAVRDKSTPRAFLQPFLEGYSALLPYVVEMVFGPDPAPRRDILERWPTGAPQPAWVALFRGGKYRAVADREGRVRLFLPGDDAAGAWRKHYPVVRHCLASLAQAAGGPLAVEVFAYRNDYRKQELRLALRPVTVDAASFPPDRASLDLTSLDEFFRQGGQLEGAQLDPDEGLVLYANPDQRNSLAGEPVSLADLAVAYRAVFHAGDNDAFISLDPNADPALASVNFGGHLEDTRVGAAVLAADRRFKTICTGLDPVTHRDERQEIRRKIPGFMTNSERAFLEADRQTAPVWIATRYWFYPESVSVDVDPLEGFAVITRPRFTADAERTGAGFDELDSRKKRAALTAGVRESIKQINADHASYAAAFPEIGDLAAVARLMAVSSWLKRSETSQLDLDVLLTVELPAASTPRTLERIISTEYVAIPPSGKISKDLVRESSEVTWMTPMLKRTVADFFGGAKAYAGYLCIVRKAERKPCASYEAEAATLFEEQRNLPLRSLLRSEQDLMNLLEFVMKKIVYPLPPEGEAARAQQVADGKRLDQLQQELEKARADLAAAGDRPPESLAAERERLESEFGSIMKRYHETAEAGKAWRTKSRIQVNGGISLRPEEFTIRKNPASPALQKFKRQAQGATIAAGPGGAVGKGGAAGKGARLVRSRPTGKIPPVAGKAASVKPKIAGTASPKAEPTPKQKPSTASPARPGSSATPAATATRATKGKAVETPAGKSAAPVAAKPAATPAGKVAGTMVDGAAPPPVAKAVPPRPPGLVAARIAVPAGTAGAGRATGELAADGRIVFRKAGQ